MRKFGVEEELLLVDAATLEPLACGETAVRNEEPMAPTGHGLSFELKQEQIEVVSPPQTTLRGQYEAILQGRALADAAAAKVGGRTVAVATSPWSGSTHLVPSPRFRRISEQFGITARQQLTNGFHVHVEVSSVREAVAVLNGIRVWLPVLLALSANSPFWNGSDTGFASYRYQAWTRWPTSGPTEVFRSVDSYQRFRQSLLDTGVPLDPGMLYFDARMCEHQSTVEIRIADVCMNPVHAAVIAGLVRALVETVARESIERTRAVPASVLRAWSWQASWAEAGSRLISPESGLPIPADEVVALLIKKVQPVLREYGEEEEIAVGLEDILKNGSGAQLQRQSYTENHAFRDVVAAAIRETHRSGQCPVDLRSAVLVDDRPAVVGSLELP